MKIHSSIRKPKVGIIGTGNIGSELYKKLRLKDWNISWVLAWQCWLNLDWFDTDPVCVNRRNQKRCIRISF